MAKFAIDDDQMAQAALDDTWRKLAVVVDKAKAAAEDPDVAAPQERELYQRWLSTFNEELGAIQTVHDASSSLRADDLRVARDTAEKLLDAFYSVSGEPGPGDER
jgi:hypothetical protein